MEDELSGLLRALKAGQLTRLNFIQRALAAGMTASTIGLLLYNQAPALAANARQAPRAKMGGTLRVSTQTPSTGLDPATQTDNGTIIPCHNIYSFVVRIDSNLIPYPDLAASWLFSPDAKTWTFPLRKGVKFHSGKALTADDVVYSISRIQNPKTASGGAATLAGVASIEKVDDLTVRFHLKAADPDFPLALADYHMCIIENNFAESNPATAFNTKPSGTGPFMLKEFVPADHSAMVRNPNYFEAGLPYLDGIRLLYLPDASTEIAALRTGTLDVITQISAVQADPLVGASGVKLATVANNGILNMRMRSDRAPFNDVRVRQAMKWVVDRKAIDQVLAHGLAPLGNDQPIGPGWPRWYSDIGLRPRDVNKAKALLAAAGHGKGLDVKLYASPFIGAVNLATAYQQLAGDAGINVTIISETVTTYYSTNDWLNVDFGITAWASRPSPSILLKLLYRTGGIWNEGHYSNPKVDALIDASSQELNTTKRKALFKQLELLLSDDGPSILPTYGVSVFPSRTNVVGYMPMQDTFHFFNKTSLA